MAHRLALTIAAIAILANALTWLHVALTPVAFFCFALVFPVFGGALISYLLSGGAIARRRSWLIGDPRPGFEMWKRLLDGLPQPQLIAFILFLAYVFINFFGTLAVTSGVRANAMPPPLEVRLITGHAAVFLLVAAGLFRAVAAFVVPDMAD